RSIFWTHRPVGFSLAQVAGGRTWGCVDLGAFPRPLPALEGLEGGVIMEDRDPRVFLSFLDYDPEAEPPLNRHGPLRSWTTQEDGVDLVVELHQGRVKVAIGFWNYGGGLFHRGPRGVRDPPELKHFPFSSHFSPFAWLQPGGMEFCEYIARQ